MTFYSIVIYEFRLTRLLLAREIPLRSFFHLARTRPATVAGRHGSWTLDPYYDGR